MSYTTKQANQYKQLFGHVPLILFREYIYEEDYYQLVGADRDFPEVRICSRFGNFKEVRKEDLQWKPDEPEEGDINIDFVPHENNDQQPQSDIVEVNRDVLARYLKGTTRKEGKFFSYPCDKYNEDEKQLREALEGEE